MLLFLLQRLLQAVLIVAAMATIVFFAIYAIGDPLQMLVPPDAGAATRQAIAAELGLDRPVWQQFGLFMWNAAHGDLGLSFVYHQPALLVVLQRLPATLELAVVALAFSVLVGIPLGLMAGLYPRSLLGRSVMLGSIFGFSLPSFWVGLMLILLFAVQLHWLPAGGRAGTTALFGVETSLLSWRGFSYLVLPGLTLSLHKMALVIRLVQAGTSEALAQDYIRFARAKGLSGRRIVGVHVLRNVLIPVVTVLGMELGSTIAFSVVTESIFAYPGMGKLLVDSIVMLDRPVVVGYLVIAVILFTAINVAVDLLHAAIDPRIRLAGLGASR